MIKSRCFLTLSEMSASRENGERRWQEERERETKGRKPRESGGLTRSGRKEKESSRERARGNRAYAGGRNGERCREPRVRRGAVCDEPEGPVRDHPNSRDPLLSGARGRYMQKCLRSEEWEESGADSSGTREDTSAWQSADAPRDS